LFLDILEVDVVHLLLQELRRVYILWGLRRIGGRQIMLWLLDSVVWLRYRRLLQLVLLLQRRRLGLGRRILLLLLQMLQLLLFQLMLLFLLI
jgi:hypothetical protein